MPVATRRTRLRSAAAAAGGVTDVVPPHASSGGITSGIPSLPNPYDGFSSEEDDDDNAGTGEGKAGDSQSVGGSGTWMRGFLRAKNSSHAPAARATNIIRTIATMPASAPTQPSSPSPSTGAQPPAPTGRQTWGDVVAATAAAKAALKQAKRARQKAKKNQASQPHSSSAVTAIEYFTVAADSSSSASAAAHSTASADKATNGPKSPPSSSSSSSRLPTLGSWAATAVDPDCVAKALLLLKSHRRSVTDKLEVKKLANNPSANGEPNTDAKATATGQPPIVKPTYVRPIMHRSDWKPIDLEEIVGGGAGGGGERPHPRLVVWGYDGRRTKKSHDPRTNPSAATLFRALQELCAWHNIPHAYLGDIQEAIANVFHPPGLPKGHAQMLVGVVFERVVEASEPLLADLVRDLAAANCHRNLPGANPTWEVGGVAPAVGGANHQQQQQPPPPHQQHAIEAAPTTTTLSIQLPAPQQPWWQYLPGSQSHGPSSSDGGTASIPEAMQLSPPPTQQPQSTLPSQSTLGEIKAARKWSPSSLQLPSPQQPWWQNLPGSQSIGNSSRGGGASIPVDAREGTQPSPQQQPPPPPASPSQASSQASSHGSSPPATSVKLKSWQRKKAKKRQLKSLTESAEEKEEETLADGDAVVASKAQALRGNDSTTASPSASRKRPRLGSVSPPPPPPPPQRRFLIGSVVGGSDIRPMPTGTPRAKESAHPFDHVQPIAPAVRDGAYSSHPSKPSPAAALETPHITALPSTTTLGADVIADSMAFTRKPLSTAHAQLNGDTNMSLDARRMGKFDPTDMSADPAIVDTRAGNFIDDNGARAAEIITNLAPGNPSFEAMLLEETAKVLDVALSSVSAREKSIAKMIKHAESKLTALQRNKLTLEQRVLKLKITSKRQSSLQKKVAQSLSKSRDSLARLLSSEMTEQEIADLVATEEKSKSDVNLESHTSESEGRIVAKASVATATVSKRPLMPTMTLRQDASMSLYKSKARTYRTRSTRAIESLGDKKFIVPFHEAEQSTWLSFWSDRSFEFKIGGFVPCLRSERVVREVLDISCREMLALDHEHFPDPRHRIEALRNTCLDARLLSSRPVHYNWQSSYAVAAHGQPRRPEIDPSIAFCPYELAGVCADPFCPYQHLMERPVGTLLPREYLILRAPWTTTDKNESPSISGVKDRMRSPPVKLKEAPSSTLLRADSITANADLLSLPALEVDPEDAETESEEVKAYEANPTWNWWNENATHLAPPDLDCVQHRSFSDQLREYGFEIAQSDRKFSVATPLDALAGCVFCGKIVEAIRLALHSGRHDVASSLLSFFGEIVRGWDIAESIMASFLSRVGLKALSLLVDAQMSMFSFDAVANKSSVRVAAESQISSAFVSFVFYLLFEELRDYEGTELNVKVHEWESALECLDLIVKSLNSPDCGSLLSDDMRDRAHAKDEFWSLFLLFDDVTISPDIPSDVSNVSTLIETLIQPVAENAKQLHKTQASDLSIRDKYHLHLRVVCQVVNVCIRALEWTMAYVAGVTEENVVKGELALLQGAFSKHVSWLEQLTSWNPTFDLIVTPLIAASASLLSTIRQYEKAQGVLARLLAPCSEGTPHGTHRLFHLSEHLWSQLVQLRMVLPPITRSVNPSDRPDYELPSVVSEANAQVAKALDELGVHPHHVCLHGDWNLVKRASQLRIEGVALLQPFRELLLAQHHSLQLRLSLRDFPLVPRSSGVDAHSSSAIPHVLFLTGSSMVELDLTHCSLTTLPCHFGRYFPMLEALYLGMNHLKALPSSLTSVQSLAVLNVDGNTLETLPQSFRFPRLRDLSAEGNKLVDLPHAIRECKELQVLNLRGNQFLSYDFASLATALPKLRLLATGIVGPPLISADGGENEP